MRTQKQRRPRDEKTVERDGVGFRGGGWSSRESNEEDYADFVSNSDRKGFGSSYSVSFKC